jgi:hypothetical protein
VTVKLVACPAASVIGAVKPETLTPVPENAILEIAALPLPVFVTVTFWVSVLPTATLPKVMAAGDTVRSATAADVAVALRSMTKEASVALLVMDTVPPSVPGELGL